MFQLTRHSFFDFTRRKTPITLIVVFPGGIFDKTPPRDIDRHSTVSHGEEGKYIDTYIHGKYRFRGAVTPNNK